MHPFFLPLTSLVSSAAAMTATRLLPRLTVAAAPRRRCCWLLGAWRAAQKGRQAAVLRAAAMFARRASVILCKLARLHNCNAAAKGRSAPWMAARRWAGPMQGGEHANGKPTAAADDLRA